MFHRGPLSVPIDWTNQGGGPHYPSFTFKRLLESRWENVVNVWTSGRFVLSGPCHLMEPQLLVSRFLSKASIGHGGRNFSRKITEDPKEYVIPLATQFDCLRHSSPPFLYQKTRQGSSATGNISMAFSSWAEPFLSSWDKSTSKSFSQSGCFRFRRYDHKFSCQR